MTYKIVGKQWRSARDTIGFIAYDCENPAVPGQWNSIVGHVPSEHSIFGTSFFPSEEQSAQYVARNGAKIGWEIAHILFPKLDITKHKYYAKEEL